MKAIQSLTLFESKSYPVLTTASVIAIFDVRYLEVFTLVATNDSDNNVSLFDVLFSARSPEDETLPDGGIELLTGSNSNGGVQIDRGTSMDNIAPGNSSLLMMDVRSFNHLSIRASIATAPGSLTLSPSGQ